MSHGWKARRGLALLVAAGLAFGLVIQAPQASADDSDGMALAEVSSTVVDFEDGTLGDWSSNGSGTLTVEVDPDSADNHVLRIDGFNNYDTIKSPVGIFQADHTYDFSMRVRLVTPTTGAIAAGFIVRDPVADSYLEAGPAGTTDASWSTIQGSFAFTADSSPEAWVYMVFGDYANPADYSVLVDDLTITDTNATPPAIEEDIPSLKDTVDFPLGAALKEDSTAGIGTDLAVKHFDQMTNEYAFKMPEWYDASDASHTLRISPNLRAEIDWAIANDIRLYGHTLIWHEQTPAWMFLDGDRPLTDSAADQALLKQRMHDHIFGVAKALTDLYGPFGSATNPLVALDVVNEVIATDSATSDGLRPSRYYEILGEEFIDYAYEQAEQAFNHDYAAAGVDRPITLAINDFNTETSDKGDRYYALIERLLSRDVPLDLIGHQTHLNLGVPAEAVKETLDQFNALGLQQAITEMDIYVGSPVTEANLIEQGYLYRDLFNVFRDFDANVRDLFSVTLWGLTDKFAWMFDQDPLLFDDNYLAKYAYYGAAGLELPARIKSSFVFAATDPAISTDPAVAAASAEWGGLNNTTISDTASFQARWSPEGLAVMVDVAGPADGTVTLLVDGVEHVVDLSALPDWAKLVATADGYRLFAAVPVTAAEAEMIDFDIVIDSAGAEPQRWASADRAGVLTLIETLSYVEAPEAIEPLVIDGLADDAAWVDAASVTTVKQVQGEGGANAEVKLTWSGDTLYILADVTDPTIDLTAPNLYERDSVEIYVDRGDIKNGPYRLQDSQMRIVADGTIDFGPGADRAVQEGWIKAAVQLTDQGYMVEAAISLDGQGGLDSLQGVDFQVNDGTAGVRTAVRNWADATGQGYQSTTHWGSVKLVAAKAPAKPDDPEETTEPGAADPSTTPDKPGATAQTGGTAVTGGLPGWLGWAAGALAL
ncbi:MAG: endo-1,4-beta-xylanase, partial [Propionibacteriaceae bacterium]|nr:endo-1,4-beta-xylanase [Propionibacteriaceae bacterium]